MPDASPFSVDRLIRLGRVTAVAPSPSGEWIAVAVSRLDPDEAKYVSDLWRVSLVDPSHAPHRLTRGASDDRAPRFRRDGSLAFLSNRNPREGAAKEGDDKRFQVWLLPEGGGEPRPITDEPLGVTDFRFAQGAGVLIAIADVLPGVPHDEQRERFLDLQKHGPSALRYGRMPVRHWDHWLGPAAPHVIAYDADGHGRRDLTPDADREHRESQWDVSADGSRVVITCARIGPDRVDDQHLRVIDVATGVVRDVGVTERVRLEHPRFAPDGRRIAASREQRFETACPIVRLWLLDADAASDGGRDLAPSFDRWAAPSAWTSDQASVLAVAADRGRVPIFRIDVASGEVSRVTPEDAGGTHEAVQLVPETETIVGIRHTLHHPPEPFRMTLAEGATPRLLGSLSGFDPADGAEIADWDELVIEGSDGVPVHSFIVRPATAARSAPLPTLLWIHGGPISHFGDGWHWRWNPLVAAAAGYNVVLPNARGSLGYGQRFVAGIWGNVWGAQCYDDLMRVTDALAARPDVDASRMAAMGGSFGGYMTNWIGGQTDRFRCLITHASLYDLAAFYGVTDVPGWFALELGGTPYADAEAFDRYSPHRYVDRWKSPTLIIHGERDYRVPIGEALSLFEALQLHGVDSELLVFPDENHWIMKPRNVKAWYDAVIEFLGRHM